MGDHTLDDGVFIRSMATRAPRRTVAGDARCDSGARHGRVPVDRGRDGRRGPGRGVIVGSADTCVVVVNPGWGGAIQANKAGLMEIADVFVINKSDRAGASGRAAIWSRCSRSARPTGGCRQSCRPSRPPARALPTCGRRSGGMASSRALGRGGALRRRRAPSRSSGGSSRRSSRRVGEDRDRPSRSPARSERSSTVASIRGRRRIAWSTAPPRPLPGRRRAVVSDRPRGAPPGGAR